MHATAQTSKDAYQRHRDSGKALTQAQRVLAFIRENPRCSRADIAAGTGIRLASVCGRVNELLEAKDVREQGVKTDMDTGMRVNTLEAMPDQGELFHG